SRADLAQAERATVAVGEERVFDAALREKLVLRAYDEQMLERAAAELHDVAEEDRASRFRDEHALFQRVDERGVVEADVPCARAAEQLCHLRDLIRRGEVGLGLQSKEAQQLDRRELR